MTRPVRVLHLIHTGGPGGAESIYRSIVLGLPREDWEPVAIVPNVEWLQETLAASGADPLVLNVSGLSTLAAVAELRRIIRRMDVRLVHAHMLGAGVHASLATFGTGIPVVTTMHGQPDLGTSSPGLRARLRLVSRRRNRIVCVSQSLLDWGVRVHRLPQGQCSVVHNGIDHHPRPLPVRSFSPPRSTLRVGAIGNVRPSKDYPTLLHAARAALDRGVPLEVRVAGGGGGILLDELLALRVELGLDAHVHFMGFESDIPGFLDDVDVFVSTSSTEGFSLAVVEALLRECPVIATRSGGPEEIILEGETGILIPPRNPAAVADALERVWADLPAARAMARAGRADVTERFSLGRMLEGYDTIYREALGIPVTRRPSGVST